MDIKIDDAQQLVGGLTRLGTNNQYYDTVKCRFFKQIIKDACFSAYVVATTDVTDEPVVEKASKLADLEATTSPYKDGIDASAGEKSTPNPIYNLKPRSDLIFECLYHSDMDEKKMKELVQTLKDEAIEEWIYYRVVNKSQKQLTKKADATIRNRLGIGFQKLDEDDGSNDAAFLTRAAEFVSNAPFKLWNPDDISNNNTFKAVLAATSVKDLKSAEKDAPVTPVKLAI